MQRNTDVHLVKMPREMWLLWSVVMKLVAPPNRPGGATEDKLEVLKPSDGRAEHVQLGTVSSVSTTTFGIKSSFQESYWLRQ